MLYPVLGVLSCVTFVALSAELAIRGDSVLCWPAMAITGVCLIVAKWSMYTDSWRWQGLWKVGPGLIFLWRWWLRLALALLVIGGFFCIVRPQLLQKVHVNNPEVFIRQAFTVLLILCNLWFTGFVLIGDQTAISNRTRQRLKRGGNRVIDLVAGKQDRN